MILQQNLLVHGVDNLLNKLKWLPFRHLLSAYGEPLLDGAYEQVVKTLNKQVEYIMKVIAHINDEAIENLKSILKSKL